MTYPPDELLKAAQRSMASRVTSQPSAPVMGNAQSPPIHAPPPIAVTSFQSAPAEMISVSTPEFLKKCAQITDAADASDVPVAVPGESALAVPVATPKPPMESTYAATKTTKKKASVLDGLREFVTSKKHGKAYVVDRSNGYPEVLAIGSPEHNARSRVRARKNGDRLKQRQIDEINEELRSEAEESGQAIDLYVRIHPLGLGGIEKDLCDGKGTTVQITTAGVRVMPGTSSTLFLRPPSAMALPVPATHGDFKRLGQYLNLEPFAFLLYISWVTYTMAKPKIESSKYVFLVLTGSQGSGKSFASKATKRLIDPNAVDAQMLPGSPRDLAIMLQSAHLLVVDNLRELSTYMSDALCIAATGGSVPMRKLYSDDEQKALYLHGAILFNGIHPFMGQSDFADRCMVLELVPIIAAARKSESQMLADFEADLPAVLGGLYALIVTVLQKLPTAEVVAPSRMLDFCRWLAAVELALGLDSGALQYPYAESLRNAQLESLLDNPLAVTIIEFADKMDVDEWVGTPTDFYDRLSSLAEFSLQRSRVWPSSAAVLSKRLHGLQAPLMAQGISIDWTRGKDRQIIVRSKKAVVSDIQLGAVDL